MWKSIKNQKYLEISKYYILGIIMGVLIFQFITNYMRNQDLDINSLFGNETLKHLVSTLIGGLVGGLIFIFMTIKNNDRKIQEKKLWLELKEKKTSFYIRNIIGFSVGGFVYKLIINLFDLSNFKNLFQVLFSTNFVIDYVGIVMAMIVFAIIISFGVEKRLNLLFQ